MLNQFDIMFAAKLGGAASRLTGQGHNRNAGV
jgi:hypothetical protein